MDGGKEEELHATNRCEVTPTFAVSRPELGAKYQDILP